MEQRTRISWDFQPTSEPRHEEITLVRDGDMNVGELPQHFMLIRIAEAQTRRSEREQWRRDTDHYQPVVREELGTFSRAQLAEFVGTATGWLAYTGEGD